MYGLACELSDVELVLMAELRAELTHMTYKTALFSFTIVGSVMNSEPFGLTSLSLTHIGSGLFTLII